MPSPPSSSSSRPRPQSRSIADRGPGRPARAQDWVPARAHCRGRPSGPDDRCRTELEASECRRIELGALLHDVGKLSIPDRVLNKPGPLNEIEWAMRRHTAAGVSLLTRLLDLPHVFEVVRSHHERWDGQGYPDGLAGEQIPLAARIVAVADGFHATTESWPLAEASGRHSGAHRNRLPVRASIRSAVCRGSVGGRLRRR
jgi:HD domain